MALFEFTSAAKTGDDVPRMTECAGNLHLSSSLKLFDTEKMRSDSDSLLNRSGPACGAEGAQHILDERWRVGERLRSDDHSRLDRALDSTVGLDAWLSGDLFDPVEMHSNSRLNAVLTDAAATQTQDSDLLKAVGAGGILRWREARARELANGFEQGRFCFR